MQRAYIEQLATVYRLRDQQRAQLKEGLEASLACQVPFCGCCGGTNLQQSPQPVMVLYISMDYCFHLAVPLWSCLEPGCGGSFVPTAFAIGCFPATPITGWDIRKARPGQPARWLDQRLLQLADSLRYQARGTAVHTLAQVLHRQHVLNGCEALVGWEHFKRQLQEALMVGSLVQHLTHLRSRPGMAQYFLPALA